MPVYEIRVVPEEPLPGAPIVTESGEPLFANLEASDNYVVGDLLPFGGGPKVVKREVLGDGRIRLTCVKV